MGLEHADAVVVVNDEARKTVSLAMHQAVAVGGLGVRKAVGFAELVGSGEHAQPEIGLRGVLVKAEDAYGNGANLVMTAGKQFAIGRIYTYQVSFGRMSHNLGNSPGEHPGVETQQGFLPAGLEYYLIHCLDIFQDEAAPEQADSWPLPAVSGTFPGTPRHP